MAQNITFLGASYSDVPAVELPKTGGGIAKFADPSVVTAVAEDVAQGKIFLDSTGAAVTGTASGGGPSPTPVITAEPNDVNFIDYDGTIRYSYTAVDALALTALPANPSHTGLTAQGWNYTLAQMKAHVQAMGKCTIGQMYTTDDGKTHIYICIDGDTPANRMTFYVRFTASTSKNTTIDWGDGTSEVKGSTSATNYAHTYASPGNYTIQLTVNSGTISFVGTGTSETSGYSIFGDRSNTNSFNRGRIRKVEIGNNVTSIGTCTFFGCYSLTSITIPDTVTGTVGNYAFQGCYSLTSITIPDGVTTIGSYTFWNCYGLTSITIPDSITGVGSNIFQNCYGLISIVFPDGVTFIATRMLNGCYSLTSVAIPSSVATIGNYALQDCYSLTSITIPSSVTSILTSTFQNCYGVSEYHLLPDTPPSLASTNAFSNIASDCIIYVPYSEDHSILTAYQNATNWSTYASKMQEEPQ